QAEDGIRDWSVTGVQTCALPILAWRAVVHFGIGLADLFLSTAWWSSLSDTRVNSFGDSRGLDFLVVSVWSERRALERTGDERLRSEERRVGKEGRSRGARYEYER